MNDARKSGNTAAKKVEPPLTDEERAAAKERVREARAAARRGPQADGEGEVLAKIAEMAPADRAIGERLHALIRAAAPDLQPRTWYGMPAYARDGKVICFFQPAQKFKMRYMTLGFNDSANLDEGPMWPVAFAVTALTAGDEAKISALVKKAAS